MERLTLEARAKLNLRLLVGPRRPDGYHDLCTLLVELAGLADTVTIEPAPERSVRCRGVEGPENLAWRALDALERRVGRSLPCAVRIDKRVPARAGLGGGSSDAGAVLRGADRLFSLGLGPDELERVAAGVGSDVPFFVRGGAQWAEGRGERLAPADVPRFAAVILESPWGLSTPAVYAAFDRLRPPPPDDGRRPPGAMPALAAWVRNDLWQAALTLQPGLGAAARRLRAAGARAALLCGSGAAIAGLVDGPAQAEALRASLGAGVVVRAYAGERPARRSA